ncbi:MAG: STAS domain-containing protein [Gammaproteobacteria bacterium]
MAEASIEPGKQGELLFAGQLSFHTVPALWQTCRKYMQGASINTINLEKVTNSDSAGLALVIACIREAAQKNSQPLRLINMPEQMHTIARISELDEIFGLKL